MPYIKEVSQVHWLLIGQPHQVKVSLIAVFTSHPLQAYFVHTYQEIRQTVALFAHGEVTRLCDTGRLNNLQNMYTHSTSHK